MGANLFYAVAPTVTLQTLHELESSSSVAAGLGTQKRVIVIGKGVPVAFAPVRKPIEFEERWIVWIIPYMYS